VSVRGFATREFELMLLRRMADLQPLLVEDAVAAIGSTREQYMAAHNRWQSMLRSRTAPRGIDLYRAVLGPPLSEREIAVGDVTVVAYAWPMPPLWPDLAWEAVIGAGNVVLNAWLVRPPGSPVPQLPPADQLAPWSCVIGDVLQAYPDARQRNPDVPSQWLVEVGDVTLRFVHGLLQTVEHHERGQ
jgi:hypothetical protein